MSVIKPWKPVVTYSAAPSRTLFVAELGERNGRLFEALYRDTGDITIRSRRIFLPRRGVNRGPKVRYGTPVVHTPLIDRGKSVWRPEPVPAGGLWHYLRLGRTDQYQFWAITHQDGALSLKYEALVPDTGKPIHGWRTIKPPKITTLTKEAA